MINGLSVMKRIGAYRSIDRHLGRGVSPLISGSRRVRACAVGLGGTLRAHVPKRIGIVEGVVRGGIWMRCVGMRRGLVMNDLR